MKKTVDGTTWNDSLTGALRAYRLGDLDLAEKRLDKAFASGGDQRPYLHLLAGHIAHSRGVMAEAEKSWLRVQEIDPGNAEAWNNLGVLYRRYGDEEKALAAFQEAEDKAPDRPDIPYNIGNLHKTAERWDEAISAYNRSIEIDSSYAPAYNNLGTLYEIRREKNKALEVFRRGLSADSGDASLRFNMGLVYQEEERWDEAREAFDTALKSRPGWTPGLNNLGIVLQEMGREDEAARTFRSLLDIEPENISALNNLGVAYDRLGRTDDARNCFKKALEEDPGYVKAALNLHDSYQENQELNEALEEINKQITHHPRDTAIRVRMGRTLMGLTRWEEAERSLDHVLERNPENAEALRAKADLYLATRRPEEAEAILKGLPHDPNVVRDLARLYMATERPKNAERLLNELIAVNTDDAESRRLMAELLAESRPEEALTHREEAQAAAPGDTTDLISLAELYGRTGAKDKALGKLDDAVNLLGSKGGADDLDAMNEVLGLYEKAASALEEEKSSLFSERTTQLGRKLLSAMGRSGITPGHSDRISAGEIPLEEEDALSLLDINAMEPIIRINEDEETVYLEESAEDLDDAYTELEHREALNENLRRDSPAAVSSPPDGAPSGGPPVHIHMPSQSEMPQIPQPPQIIYQDIRPVTNTPKPPRKEEAPILSVGEIEEEDVPELILEEPKEESSGDNDSMELLLEEGPDLELVEKEEIVEEEEIQEEEPSELEEEPSELEEEVEEDDDEPFFIPESDALSEDLPETIEPDLPLADLIFPGEEEPEFETPALLDTEEELVLLEDLEELDNLNDHQLGPVDEDEHFSDLDGDLPGEEGQPGEEGLLDEEEKPSEEETDHNIDPDKMAGMFKYLSDLTEETTGEGRQQLIEDGVPLKLAGLHAKLSGEPSFRKVAQKYDRRRRERHNVELDEEKIRESLNAFKTLAESFPQESVRESLSQKLGKIMNGVRKIAKKAAEDEKAEDLNEPPSPSKPSGEEKESEENDGNIPAGLIDGLAEEVDAADRGEENSEEVLTAHEDFAAVLPDLED